MKKFMFISSLAILMFILYSASAGSTYTGSLYDTSMQLGNNQPINLLFSDMANNNVTNILGFFYVDPSSPNSDIRYIKRVIKKHPNKVIPFFQFDWEKIQDIKVKEVDKVYKKANFFKGVGEIQTYDFKGINADHKNLQALYKYLQKKKLKIMTHPPTVQEQYISKMYKKYPKLIFVQHGLDIPLNSWSDLMNKHKNFYFSLDTGHFIMREGDSTGLLWVDGMTKEQFISIFDSQYQTLLQNAVDKWGPFVEAHPDRIMWGTEISLKWHFDPQVYNRIISFTRDFISQLSPGVQDKFAYQNARRILGKGLK